MEIVVYVSETCGYCTKQKEFMNKQGIDYVEKNINKVEENFLEFQELGGVAIPYTVKREEGMVVDTITGFHREKLLEALK
jgi:glutaredoxin